ncbi:MAG: glutathione S-transferase N-terminal domain-containing protein [Candidatus Goldbacteria bacterium]|nr:glutathione S-transferase N-terminal domain-containing protein [Candidatus Goldiibacteriota bacterium]
MIINVQSVGQLREEIEKESVIGFFGGFSEKSKKAEEVFKKTSLERADRNFYYVDAALAKDVNKYFGITAVPSVIKVKGGRVERGVYGEAKIEEYLSLVDEAGSNAAVENKRKKETAVIVYSTPSCSWCVKVKSYLKEKGIRFTDVDVSKDEKAVRELVNKTGQTGVPQLKIGGVYVVGFDKDKINSLLGL